MKMQLKKRIVQWGIGGACALALMGGGMERADAAPAVTSAFHSVTLTQGAAEKTTGEGEYTFKVLYTAEHLPEAAQAVLVNAHGGFAIDKREGKGEIYFALPGAGIVQISADFSSVKMIASPDGVKNNNMHNTTIWQAPGGESYLTFPSNGTAEVYTTGLDGSLQDTLGAPGDFDFGNETVNAYFAGGEQFVPTDVEYLDGKFYITTGYSKLDYVLTAKVDTGSGVKSAWNQLAFGGKGDGEGQFGTGHGITVTPDGQYLVVADRPNSEVEVFSGDGTFATKVDLPKGSFPCDTDFEAGYALVGCLHGPNRDLGAPIYLLKDQQVISTIMPKEELGLEKFTHIHNAVLRELNGKLYIIAQAWNPGDFAILEQVK